MAAAATELALPIDQDSPPTSRSFEAIAREPTSATRLYRWHRNPRILVIDFASLDLQGAVLNRIAAFVEKGGAPRDRLLTDVELARLIGASGADPPSYVVWHDYPASDLARFCNLAERDDMALNPQVQALRALLQQNDFFAPGPEGALEAHLPEQVLVTIAQGTDPQAERARRAILRQELSHAEFFQNPRLPPVLNGFLGRACAGATGDYS